MKYGWKRVFAPMAVAAAAALVAGSAVALAGSTHKRPLLLRTLRTTVHADVSLIRANGSTDSFSVDRGRVTAASQTSVTLQRPDGKSVKLGIAAGAMIRGSLVVSKGAIVFSRGGVAFRIRAPGAVHTPLTRSRHTRRRSCMQTSA